MKKKSKKILVALIAAGIVFAVVLVILLVTSHKKPDSVPSPTLTKEQKTKVKEIQVQVHRYEQDLFALNIQNLAEEIENLYGKYPENLISKDCWKNTQMVAGLKAYLTDPTIQNLYKEVEKQYPDFEDVTQELQEAFKIYASHFPDAPIPEVYTLIPGLDFEMPPLFLYDDDLFICLDMYLGSDCKYYGYAGMPKYISQRCQRQFIATDCFTRGLAYKHLPDKTLLTGLDNMIYEGKKLFFTQTMFPLKSEQEIIGYTDEKYEWAKKYESQVWQYFIEKNMLYSKNDDIIRRLVDETPFTRDFGNSSPGRLGTFIGWHIVKNYMKNHPKTTLEELMALTDAQQLLKESYYKP